ncbi:MAG: hypothetical protein WCO84_08270, partial [bacterium]
MKRLKLIIFGVTLIAGVVLAQRQRWGVGGGYGGDRYYPEDETASTAREGPSPRTGTPTRTNDDAFDKEGFHFSPVRHDRLEAAG